MNLKLSKKQVSFFKENYKNIVNRITFDNILNKFFIDDMDKYNILYNLLNKKLGYDIIPPNPIQHFTDFCLDDFYNIIESDVVVDRFNKINKSYFYNNKGRIVLHGLPNDVLNYIDTKILNKSNLVKYDYENYDADSDFLNYYVIQSDYILYALIVGEVDIEFELIHTFENKNDYDTFIKLAKLK